jgi:hypothetical protein
LGRKGTWSLAPSRARAQGRSWPTAPAPWPPSCPRARACRSAPKGPRQLVSSARARPVTRCRRARAPRFDRPQCLCVEVSVCPYVARARPAYIDPAVCVSVCIYICMSVCMSVCMYGTGGPCRPISVQMAGGVACEGVYIYIYMWVSVCIYIWMDATGGPCRHMSRPMTMCVSRQVSVCGARGPPVPPGRARLAGADQGARRPTGHSRGARAPGLCRPQCLCVSISVCLSMARAPGLPVCARRPRQLVTFPPARPQAAPRPVQRRTPAPGPPRGASHRANSAGQLAAARPHRALTSAPLLSSPSLPPSSPSRAHTPAGSSPAPAPWSL